MSPPKEYRLAPLRLPQIPPGAKRTRGITLVEVLVAAAVTLLLAGLLLAVASNLLIAWGRATGSLEAEGQADIVLDQLARDLEATVSRADAQAWFVATVQNDQSGAGDAGMTNEDWPTGAKPGGLGSLLLEPGSGELADAHFGQAGVWLRFFTTQPDANDQPANRSVPRAVAYQLVRRRNGGQYVYQLYRSQVRPSGASSTFGAGYSLFAPAYTTPSGVAQNPGNVRRPNAQYLIGNNIIDFGMRVWARATDGSRVLVFPSGIAGGHSLVATTDSTTTPIGYAGKPVTRTFPATIDIMVRVLSPDGKTAISNLEAGFTQPPPNASAADFWWRVAEAHSSVFVRRIE